MARWGDYPQLMRAAEEEPGRRKSQAGNKLRGFGRRFFEAIDEGTICVRIFMSVIDRTEVKIDGDLIRARMR